MTRAEVPETAGLAKLRRVAGQESQASIAKRVGVAQQTMSLYLRGHSRPGPHVRAALERLYDIPATDWYTPAELRIACGDDHPRTGTHS